MSGLYPASDAFQSGSPSYGSKLTTYLRHVLFNSDAATGYSISCGIGTMHSGYFAPLKGATARWGKTLKACAITATGAADGALCGWLYRPYEAADVMPIACFSLKMLAGNYSDSLRYIYVTARNTGGATNNTAGSERLHTGDCYALLRAHDVAVGGARYLLLRIINGVPTTIGSSALFTISAEDAMRPISLALHVETISGNVHLTPYVEFYSHVSPSGGLGPRAVMGTIVDSSGSKITAAGRVGGGMSMEREQTSPTRDSVTLCHFFGVKDLASDAYVLMDEWDRACLDGAALVTGELHGRNGRVLNCMWGGEWGSLNSGLIGQPGGPNDTAYTTSSSQNWVMFSSRAATRDHYTRRRVTVRFDGASTGSSEVGIMGRGVSIYDVSTRRAYVFRMTKGSGSFTASAQLRCYDGAHPIVQLRQMSFCTVSALQNAPWSLAYNQDIVLELEVENVGGTDASIGIPRLRARINGTLVTGWTLTPLLTGVRIDGSDVYDERPERILTGREEGIHILTDSGTHTFSFDDWEETQPAGVDLGHDAQESIAVGGEDDGKTGTFGSWSDSPVYHSPEIRRFLPVSQNHFESGHVQRVQQATRERRYFRLPMNVAKRVGEADEMRDFFESHEGASVPFDFKDPRTGAIIPAQFNGGRHTTTATGPNSAGYEVELEELIP